jgi:flagellar biosynthesis anti-sigma factor FlgM
MTSSISSYSSGPAGSADSSSLPTPPAASSVAPSSTSPADAAIGAGEAVTLTADARASTDLLEAARAADGVDYQAVQSTKDGIASGTYQVAPESLAASIIAALSETQS